MMRLLVATGILVATRFADGFPALGGYTPVSNVLEHIDMGLDVQAFIVSLKGTAPDFAKALAIYTHGGGASCKSPSTARKLKDFATANLTGETFHDMIVAAGLEEGFWDKWLLEALEGTGTFAGLSQVKRATFLRNAVHGLMTYYVSHELESGIVKAMTASTRNDLGSAHAWSEGWAFYAGDGVEGTGTPWSETTEYDGDFDDGLAVRTSIVPHFNKGLRALRADTYDAAAAVEARDTIYTLWAMIPIRASLKYLQMVERTYSEKQHSEGYGQFLSTKGWLQAKAPNLADAMQEAYDVRKDSIPAGTFCALLPKMYKALPSLGLDCSMLGTYQEAATRGIQCEVTCEAMAVSLPSGAAPVDPVAGEGTDMTCQPSNSDTETLSSSTRAFGLPLLAVLALLSSI